MQREYHWYLTAIDEQDPDRVFAFHKMKLDEQEGVLAFQNLRRDDETTYSHLDMHQLSDFIFHYGITEMKRDENITLDMP
jgi:hypothetical protein